MKKKIYLLLFCASALLGACRRTKLDKSTAAQSASEIAFHQCLQQPFAGSNLRLCFTDLVEDSRCPLTATCVWQGVARVKFLLQVDNASYSFILSTLNNNVYHTDTTVQQYKISLLKVKPYPGEAPATIPTAVVQVTTL